VALLQVLYFAVPVMYFAEHVKFSKLNEHSHGLLFSLYMLNPLVTILTAFRAWMLQPTFLGDLKISTSGHMDARYLLFTTALSLAVALTGYALFNRMKWSFVERP
jgi:homopolymeric O-antigen transport system permease protein